MTRSRRTGPVLQLLSRRSLEDAHDFLDAVQFQIECLPQYLPVCFGWEEPINQKFDLNSLKNLVPPDGFLIDTFWRRTENGQATGSWMPRWRSGVPYLGDTHSSIKLEVFDTANEAALIEYLKRGVQNNHCDFGFIEWLTPEYRPIAIENHLATYGHINVTTHRLRHWLPDLPWATVFGSAYCRMFGKEHILATPAYRVEDIGPEEVYIQLTPKLQDLVDDFAGVMAARHRGKSHLGLDAFYDRERAYNQREHADWAGEKFRVPEFVLE